MPADAKVLYMVVQCGACKAKFVPEFIDREIDYGCCYYEGDVPDMVLAFLCPKCGAKTSTGFYVSPGTEPVEAD